MNFIKTLSSTVLSKIDYCSFFRMSISALAIISVIMYGEYFYELFAGKTITLRDMHEVTNYRENIAYWLLSFFNTDNLVSLFSTFRTIYIVALFFLFFGFFTRISAAIAFVLNLIIYYNSPLLIYGYDEFMHLSLLFCVIFKVSSKLSVDNLISNGEPSQFLILHFKAILAVCYFFSGLSKALDGLGWWNGQKFINAIHYRTVVDKNTFFVDLFSEYSLIAVGAGVFTVILELAFPILMFVKKYRLILLYFMVLFHLGISIILQLTAFSTIMIIWNIAALYPFQNKSNNPIPLFNINFLWNKKPL